MKINISAGHCPDGKGACGAVGYLKESTEARNIKTAVIKYMAGHTVRDCTDDEKHSSRENLQTIASKHNKNAADMNISVHLNAKETSKKDGKNKGVEVLVTGNWKSAEEMAERICKKISELGFTNRGVKVRKELYFLNQTKGASLLIEVCFVDDEDDAILYKKIGADRIGKAIAEGITGKAVSASKPSAPVQTPKPTPTTSYYKKYTGQKTAVDAVLKAIDVPDKFIGSWAKRKPIAQKNGISGYKGTAMQNLKIVQLAKSGKLKRV